MYWWMPEYVFNIPLENLKSTQILAHKSLERSFILDSKFKHKFFD